MFGAGVVLASGLWTLRAADIELWGLTPRLLEMGPIGLSIAWTSLAIIGMCAQRRMNRDKRDTQGERKPALKSAG